MGMGFLHGVEVVEVTDGPRTVRTVASAVIGLVGTALRGAVNTPTVVASRAAGAEAFGAAGGTIPAALEAIYDQAQAVVVVVNALDPSARKRAVAALDTALAAGKLVVPDADGPPRDIALGNRGGTITYRRTLPGRVGDYAYDGATRTITRDADRLGADTAVAAADYDAREGVVTLPHQRIKTGATLVVKNEAGTTTYQTPRDYAVDAAAGTVTRTNAGTSFAAGDTLNVKYTYLGGLADASQVTLRYNVPDASAVVAADVIGAVAADGGRSGTLALLAAESVTGRRPRILVAPGWSDQQAVATALVARADRLRAVAVLDGPSTTDAAAIAHRGNIDSRRAYLVDPAVRVGSPLETRPASGYAAGVIARSDAERGWWWSPSNRPINSVLGTERAVEFELGVEAADANQLNASEVATIIRMNGYRLWGNRTLSSDPKYQFLSVARTADIIQDSLLRAHLWAVDRNITRTYVEDVAQGVNDYLRDLRAAGAILAGECRPSEVNTPSRIQAGQVCFDIDFTPPVPAERVTFRVAITDDGIEELLA